MNIIIIISNNLSIFIQSTPEEAEKWWNLQYDVTLSNCSHSYW